MNSPHETTENKGAAHAAPTAHQFLFWAAITCWAIAAAIILFLLLVIVVVVEQALT